MAGSRHPDLSVERIVQVSSPIFRIEGEQGLSLRRVARQLDVTAMALYHHIANKEALVDLMMDDVLSEALVPPPSADEPWRDALIGFLARYRRVLIDNPGAGRRYIDRPVLVPATARTTLYLFELLERGGFTGGVAAEAADALVLVVMGSLTNDLTRPPAIREKLLDHVEGDEAERLRSNVGVYAARDGEQRFVAAADWVLRGLSADRL